MQTLEIWVSPTFVDELGWQMTPDTLQTVPGGRLSKLTELCHWATRAVAYGGVDYHDLCARILHQLELVLAPWLAGSDQTDALLRSERHYAIFTKAERMFPELPWAKAKLVFERHIQTAP